MADGGIAMDKSPSPPKMDWTKQSPLEMSGSLTDHLQRLLAIKKQSGTNETDPSATNDDSADAAMRIRRLLAERDEMWREHERSQMAFMEREHEKTLRGLHQEIERLQLRCTDLTRQLAETLTTIEHQSNTSAKDSDEVKLIIDLENQLKSTRAELAAMRELHDRKHEKLLQLEQRCDEQDQRHKQELENKNKQVQEISADLSHKAAMVAQLTTQLHQLRLREAVEKQRFEQRRQMAEQQAKRRQALAAAKADLAPHRASSLGKNGSPSRSQTMPSKITVQVAAEPSSSPSHTVRRPAARMMTTTTSGSSPPSSARRTRSLALPSIMSTSTPGPSASPIKAAQEPKRTASMTIKAIRPATSKPQE